MASPRRRTRLRTYSARTLHSKESHHALPEANEPSISSNPALDSTDTNDVASCSSQHSGNECVSTVNVNEPDKREVWFTMSQSELQNLGLHAEIREGKAVITSTSTAQSASGLENIIYRKLQENTSEIFGKNQTLQKKRVPHNQIETVVSCSKNSDKTEFTAAGTSDREITTVVSQMKQEDSSMNPLRSEPKENELESQSVEMENQSIEKIIAKWGSTSGYVRRYQAIYFHHWEKSLQKIGYIRCPMQDCNYISLSREDMTNHYACCKSIPQFDKNVCPHCMKCLGTDEDLKKHIRISHVSLSVGSAPEESDADIRSIADNLRGSILPRRRSFGKVHKKSWTIALEKQGFVKCIFRNCSYLALTVEEMIQHYGGCRADGMGYPFTCKYCKGGMETKEKLKKHLTVSHKSECMAELRIIQNKEQYKCYKHPEVSLSGIQHTTRAVRSSKEESTSPRSSNAFLLSVSTNEEGESEKVELISLSSVKKEEIEIEDFLIPEEEYNSISDISFSKDVAQKAFKCSTNVPEKSKPAQTKGISNSPEKISITGNIQNMKNYVGDSSRKQVTDKQNTGKNPVIGAVEDIHTPKTSVEASVGSHTSNVQKQDRQEHQYSFQSINKHVSLEMTKQTQHQAELHSNEDNSNNIFRDCSAARIYRNSDFKTSASYKHLEKSQYPTTDSNSRYTIEKATSVVKKQNPVSQINQEKMSLKDVAKCGSRKLMENMQHDTLDGSSTASDVPSSQSSNRSVTTYLTSQGKQEGKSKIWVSELVKKSTEDTDISFSSFKKIHESKESLIDDLESQKKVKLQENNQPKRKGRPKKNTDVNNESPRTLNFSSLEENKGTCGIDAIDPLSPELGRGKRKRKKKKDDLFEELDLEPKRKRQRKFREVDPVEHSDLLSAPTSVTSEVNEECGVPESAVGEFKNIDEHACNEELDQHKTTMEQEYDNVVQNKTVEEKDEDFTFEVEEQECLLDSEDSECDSSASRSGRGRGRGRSRGRGRARRRGGSGVGRGSEEVEGEGDGMGRKRGRGRGRGRGRVRGTMKKKGTKALMKMTVSARLAMVRKEDELAESDTSPEALAMVECGKCGEVMMRKCFSRHNREKHMGLGWTEGEEPVDMEDEKLLMRILSKVYLTVKKLICDKCGVSKKSAVGFISHLQCCQKSNEERIQLRMPCVICGRLMLPASLKVHMYTVHKKDAELPEKPVENVVLLEEEKKKRVAATKAVTRMQQFIGAEEGHELDIAHKRSNSPSREELYKKVAAVRMTNRYIGSIKRMLSRKGVASCRYPGCDFTSSALEELLEHNKQCINKPEEGYACRKCSFHAEEETDMITHVQKEHADAVCSDVSDDSESISSLEDEEDASFQKKPVEPKSNARFGRSRASDGIAYLRQENSGPVYGDRPFYPALRWTVNYFEKRLKKHFSQEACTPHIMLDIVDSNSQLQHYEQYLFRSLHTTAHDWMEVPENEVDDYLPDTRESIAFTSHCWDKKVESLPENISSRLKKLKLFEGDIQSGNPVFFAGGPVWCLAWCPLPLKWTIQAYARVNQFIAVSCHKSMESEYCMGENYAHKGLIQIWSLGNLQNKSECSAPVFGMGIAHDYGTVWCMEWCPSGCYDMEERNDGTLLRVGLLAAACSDGTVRIYSVCDPAQLETPKNGFKIFKPQPVATLILDNDNRTEDKKWQCIRISWHGGKGHRAVAGGFTNGMVAVWNMKFDTQILKLHEGKSQIILPYKIIQAHHGAVTAVAFSPLGEDPRYLLTGSIDRAVKFWDLEESYSPITINKKGNSITCGVWLPHWVAALIGYDDGFGYTHTNSSLHTLRGFGFGVHPLFTQNSVTWDLAANMWLNAMAQTTEAGELSVIFAHQLLYCADLDRAMKHKRLMMSYVDLIELEKSDDNNEDSSDNSVNIILNSCSSQKSNEMEENSAVSNIAENLMNNISDVETIMDKVSVMFQGINEENKFEIEFVLEENNEELMNNQKVNANEIQVQTESISSIEISADSAVGDQNDVHKMLQESEKEEIKICSLYEKTSIIERENQDNEIENVKKHDERQDKHAKESNDNDDNIDNDDDCDDSDDDISDYYNEDEYFEDFYDEDSEMIELIVPSEVLKAEALKDPFFEPHPFSERFRSSVGMKLSSFQTRNKYKDNPSIASVFFHTSPKGSIASEVKETQMKNSLEMQAKDYQKLKICDSKIINNKLTDEKENSGAVIIAEAVPEHEEGEGLQEGYKPTKISFTETHIETLQTCSSTYTIKDSASMNDESSIQNAFYATSDLCNDSVNSNRKKEYVTKNITFTKNKDIKVDAEMNKPVIACQKLHEEGYSSSSLEKTLKNELPKILFTTVPIRKVPTNDNSNKLKDAEQIDTRICNENDHLLNNNIDESVNTEIPEYNAFGLSMQNAKSQALNSDPSEEPDIDLPSDDESLGDFPKPFFVKPEAKTYADAKSSYGMIFCDFPTHSMAEILPESRSWMSQSDKMRPSEVNAYPILSINRVAWNPNCRSFLWLTAGYQCGLVRTLCFRAMHTPTVDDILRKAAWNISNQERFKQKNS